MSDQIPLSPSTESDRVFDHTVVSATPDRHGLARPADALLSNISVSPVDPTAPNLLEQLAASTMALNHNIGLFQAHMAQQLEILQRLATDRAHYRTELEEMRPIVTDLRDTVDDRFKHLSSSAPYAESDAVKQPICSLWGCEYVGQVRIARSDTVCKAIAAAAEILPHWHDEWTEEARLSTLQHFSDTEFQQNANAIIPVYAAEMGIDDILARAEVQRFASLILGSGKWFDSRGELQDRPPTDMRGHAVAGSILLIDADWAYPIWKFLSKTIPELVMGNVVIIKAPLHTPLGVINLFRRVQDFLPPGVVQILAGDARDESLFALLSGRQEPMARTR